MKKLFSLFVAALCCASMWAEDGALSGRFTINSNGEQVVFSQGNLQFQARVGEHLIPDGTLLPGTFRFAVNQYDYVGDTYFGNVFEESIKSNNQLVAGEDYLGWIDMFGWGTGLNPIDTSAITPDQNNYIKFIDWGINAIGGTNKTWRTLTADEWQYLFYSRTDAKKLFGYGKIDDINGLIILPDDWQLPEGSSFISSIEEGVLYEDLGYGYKVTKDGPHANDPFHNEYSSASWIAMQDAGAVFLPAGGSRYYHNEIQGVSVAGHYWSSTPRENDDVNAFYMCFAELIFYSAGATLRATGCAVRLVSDCKSTDVEQIINDKCENEKLMINGHLYIHHNGKTYNVSGAEVR